MLENELISLARAREITYKDVALILLVKDGIKPLSSVGLASSQKLIYILQKNEISFAIKNNRIHIGEMTKSCHSCPLFSFPYCKNSSDIVNTSCSSRFQNGINFGFPDCCSTLFFNPVAHFFSKNSKSDFSDLSPYVFHVPCSGKCHKTKKLAIKYKVHIKKNYPIIAESIENN